MKNYLKRLYKLDKKISFLKEERKNVMEIINQNDIKSQGSYLLKRDSYEVRKVNVEKFKAIVSQEQFNESIIVPVCTAEKVLSGNDLEGICSRSKAYKIYVIKV